jgi:sugar-specific transcriptional regulator TrmB
MKDRDSLALLQKIGLTEKEARIYHAALSLGPSTVSSIAKASVVKRTTAYSIIDSLVEKNLMTREVHGIKELWQAAEPEALRTLLDDQQQALNRALPELHSLYRFSDAESVIKYYEGMDSLKEVYLEMLRTVRPEENYMVLSDQQLWLDLDPDFLIEFRRKRSKLNIRVRMILTDSPLARESIGRGRMVNEENRLLPEGTALTTNLVIIPRKVFIHQMEPPIMGMVIENPHIIRMHSEMYELIWRGLPSP